MRSNKKYSNVSFTKRVDHDAGRHHTPRAPSEPAICEVCGAVYADRRWTSASAPEKQTGRKDWHPASVTICPACKQEKEGVPAGFFYLDGPFLTARRDEIERLVRNEALRAAEDNPLARIIGWQAEESGRLSISTSTEHLAKRLGQAVEKAFGGDVRYDFSHENKLARVYWHRD